MSLRAYNLTPGDPGDRFTVACALYWHCADYHEGQGSARYRVLSALGYEPGACERGPEAGSVDADIYNALASGDVTVDECVAFLDVWEEK